MISRPYIQSIIFLFIFLTSCTSLCISCRKWSKKVYNDIYNPNELPVRFHIYQTNIYNAQQNYTKINIKQNDSLPLLSICDSGSKPYYKIIIHGFSETWNMSVRWNWVESMKNEMLKSHEADKLCIIVVDWEELGKGGRMVANYWRAIENMKIAGDLISDYFRRSQINERHMHCIGFSLGAHMCSVFYKTYFAKFQIRPGRLTGLDPAGPFFSNKSLSEKLHFSDAHLVDIIHTSSTFGLPEKNGHMNFYPDKGPSEVAACSDLGNRYDTYNNVILYQEGERNEDSNDFTDVTLTDKEIEQQGGIQKLTVKSVLGIFADMFNFMAKKPKRVFTKLHQFFGCSHLMSVRLFMSSINDCLFKSQFCASFEDFKQGSNCTMDPVNKDWPRMGYYADRTSMFYRHSHGSFFLETTQNPPFCADPVNS